MNYLTLLVIITGIFLQNIFQKKITEKPSFQNRDSVFVYGMIMSAAAGIFILVVGLITQAKISTDIISYIYSAGFSVSFFLAVTFWILAIKNGSLALTALIVSYSLMIPTIFGIVFFDEALRVTIIIGIILLLISLFLINSTKGIAKPTKKWIIFAAIAFFSNGMCSIFQKLHQSEFIREFAIEFLLTAMIIVLILNTVCFMILKEKKRLPVFKQYLPFSIGCGVSNAVTNILVLLLISKFSISLMFPLISVGSILITFIFSKLLFHEKFNKLQIAGFCIGLVSLLFLNL